MKYIHSLLSSTFIVVILASFNSPNVVTVAEGQQPQISLDNTGIIRIVFGRSDSIFCSASANKGKTFGKAVLVGVVKNMHLGMARGPQFASSAHYSVITAMDKTGNIHFFLLNNQKGRWQDKGLVNDIKAVAPEGLMNIACDNRDNFYATWLDLRLNKRNNIFFSSLPAGHTHWLKNTLVYQSPDEHVCECCRPSITVKGTNVAIMFRNWLNGSRDLYLATSANKGQTFKSAVKLGAGTWKLNACPMDGGGLSFNADNTINTTWQRQGTVYYCKFGEYERDLGSGRDCSISSNGNETLVSMSEGGNLKYKNLQTNKETAVGKGSYLKTMILPDNSVLCVWEENHEIKSRVI
ncbi:hypothetical protein [Mucilaginibacter panaciglaebae]|uniref:BNR repeat protein n=1 Tax=Mucilaginibacter panaciglaebae TaxID=502331 RepID=A0ABP7X130_9SPHI